MFIAVAAVFVGVPSWGDRLLGTRGRSVRQFVEEPG
jgi:hypothetical protein